LLPTSAGSRNRRGRARPGWLILAIPAAVLLVASLAGCTPGPRRAAPATPSSSSSPSGISTTTPASPIPAPTGPPLTPALAAAPHFLLFLGGSLTDLAVTRIEGQDIDAPAPRAVMEGAPEGPAQSIFAPALSPDRKRIAYVQGVPGHLLTYGGDGQIVVQNVDGTGAKVVAPLGNNGAPAWSPDGKQIAFLQGDALWLMGADGSNPHSLELTLPVNTHIAWSPNGRKLAVGTGSPSRIAVVDLASLAYSYLGPTAAQQDHPAWSPDGKQLAYAMGGANALFVANADGSEPRQLTTCVHPECSRDLEPAWSPDGAYVAFVRYAPGAGQGAAQQVYVVPAAGGDARRITSGAEGHAFPSW
jgi:Tol biopolymer transport system component